MDFRVLFLGFDDAGKTALLYKMKGMDIPVDRRLPTVGFNVESMNSLGRKMTVWDVGGGEQSRQLWKHFYQNTQTIVFVVDSTDRARIGAVRDEMHSALRNKELSSASLLVVANKQDFGNAMSPDEISLALELDSIAQRICAVQPCSALTGDGVQQALEELVNSLQKQVSPHKSEKSLEELLGELMNCEKKYLRELRPSNLPEAPASKQRLLLAKPDGR
jgi:small GTP-binding protein